MGTGFSFDRLSEKGAFLTTSQGEASGPVSFMQVFNKTSQTVEQGGKRRAANMGILGCDHPDIIEFIEVKNKKECSICGEVVLRNVFKCPKCGNKLPEDNTLNYFNLSVGVNDKFVKYAIDLVENNKDHDWELYSRRNEGEVVKVIKFSELWNKIIYYAWYSGDPGLINLYEINKYNPMRDYKLIESTNPCGEQSLLPYDSCNLGSINLDVLTSNDGYMDYHELSRVVRLSVDFLDNVIDVNKYPLPEIDKATKETRNIGLGVMGVARMLQKMEISYDSKEGREKVYDVLHFIQEIADNQSIKRGKKYGVFPLFDESIYKNFKYRNATRTTIAPTGSISTLADTSGGIEPDFSHRFTRVVNIGDKNKEFKITVENPVLVDKLKKYDLYSNELMQEIEDNGGRLPDVYQESSILRGLSQDTLDKYSKLKEVFKTAGEVSVEGHIDMVIEAQKVINSSISKTINMPNSASIRDVEDAFLRMLKGGAKGVTVYRDGSRMFQPLQLNIKDIEKEEKEDKKARGYVEPPQDELPSIKKRLYTGCGKLYVHADYDSKTGDIKEIFIDKGSTGGCLVFTKATSRLLSVGIRGGIPLEVLVDQLNSAGSCPSWQLAKGKGNELSVGMSCPSAIGREIMRIQEKLYKDLDKNNITKSYKKVEVPKEVEKEEKPKCPECGEELSSESGCIVCRHCGYSKC